MASSALFFVSFASAEEEEILSLFEFDVRSDVCFILVLLPLRWERWDVWAMKLHAYH